MAATQSPKTENLFTSAPRLRAQRMQLQTGFSQQMNKLAFLLEPLGSALKQLLESLTTSPIDRAILFQSAPRTGAHLIQPNSEVYEAEDRCFRVSE